MRLPWRSRAMARKRLRGHRRFPGRVRLRSSQKYLKFGNEEEIGKTMSPAKAWFDRSTRLTALRPSKGKLSTLRKIEGQRREVTDRGPSSRANARDLRKISPFGRNDTECHLAPWRDKFSWSRSVQHFQGKYLRLIVRMAPFHRADSVVVS